MKLANIYVRLTIAVALSATLPEQSAMAQQPGGTNSAASIGAASISAASISAASMDSFAAAHVEVEALRSKAQAELAEPRSKKGETQVTLREKLQEGTLGVLKAHGLTEAEFTRLTRLVSTDGALRKQFDEAVARYAASRGSEELRIQN